MNAPDQNAPREIVIGTSDVDQSLFPSNYVRTTKYTALTFIPVALYLQFKRYANIYFLVVAILQSIPAISPLNPISAIAPLIFVVSLSMIREAFEDLARYKADLETNSTKTRRYREGKWYDAEWKDLLVGDVVKVDELEFFPADIVLLSSADPKGAAFIMTSTLDGEKNLKPKFAPRETQRMLGRGEDFVLMGTLKFGPPDENLYSFSGSLALGEKPIGLGAKQLLLRGAMLKNTEWVIGVVTYTGAETKLMKNSGNGRFKQSNIETLMNTMILLIIAVELAMCLIIFICAWAWGAKYAETYAQFVPLRMASFPEAVLTFFTIFVLLNTMIPISLIISLEMVKMTQAYFINRDEDMLDAKEGRFSKAFSSSLNEELGQIEYIFTDKTGTLTANVLEFKYALVADAFFGDKAFLEDHKPLRRQPSYVNREEGISFSFDNHEVQSILKGSLSSRKQENFVFYSAAGAELFRLRDLREVTAQFLLNLSLCHDCLTEVDKENPGLIKYQGLSPDEVALVDAARHMGYIFKGSTSNGKIVGIEGEDQEIEVLQFFEFDSERKRSSIIVRHDGIIKFFIKGADSAILQRLSAKAPQPYLSKTKNLLEKFSLKGLRTLCYGMKVLSADEYEEIASTLQGFESSLDKAHLVAEFAARIERDFLLLGCTAVEDKLQDKVPQCIADFIVANIKVWMLTGDKLETAENIAYSCQLIQEGFIKHYLREQDDITEKLLSIGNALSERRGNAKHSLIIEGPVVMRITENKDIARRYVEEVFSFCDSVVCCRMSPNGKGDVVSLIKDYKQKITLAIGDGANDVNMIKRAHIGIGLYGKEGMRAVQASDYGLVEFKSLWKLLFVHGRWSYIRISEMIQYFFYKNIIFAFPQFVYCFFNAFSGQTIYDDFYITFYNLIFTSWPVIIRAVLDQDIYYKKWTRVDRANVFDKKVLYENKLLKQFYPYLYYVGQQDTIFKWAKQLPQLLPLGHQWCCDRSHYLLFHEVFAELARRHGEFVQRGHLVRLHCHLREHYFRWLKRSST